MSEFPGQEVRATIDSVFRTESSRVLATLIRLLGDFGLAEDALQEAFAAAMTSWPETGVPANPRAWLVSAGRFRAIDALRRRSKFDLAAESLAIELEAGTPSAPLCDDAMEDDRLRLIFTCCHPALPPDTQVALTLREVCGLATEDIAWAFLIAPSTVAQRIVRAKAKIRSERIPYAVPDRAEMPERLEAVLRVVYLVFNEGYAAATGDPPSREDLSREAIRLGRLLVDLLPDAEAMGLLALMFLHESRRATRHDADGELVLLPEQDRSRWDRGMIEEGSAWLARALAEAEIGTYTLQAAIASEHARATTAAETDWAAIVAWYDRLLQADPSPVAALNRAVAIAMRDGPAAGLRIIDELITRPELRGHALAHAARADLFRRLDRANDARAAYATALQLTRQAPERRFLERCLCALSQGDREA